MYQYQAHTIDDNKMLTQVNMGGGKQDASLTFGFYTYTNRRLSAHS